MLRIILFPIEKVNCRPIAPLTAPPWDRYTFFTRQKPAISPLEFLYKECDLTMKKHAARRLVSL